VHDLRLLAVVRGEQAALAPAPVLVGGVAGSVAPLLDVPPRASSYEPSWFAAKRSSACRCSWPAL
jgi:hypothetical protein